MVGSVQPGLICLPSTVIFYSSLIPHRPLVGPTISRPRDQAILPAPGSAEVQRRGGGHQGPSAQRGADVSRLDGPRWIPGDFWPEANEAKPKEPLNKDMELDVLELLVWDIILQTSPQINLFLVGHTCYRKKRKCTEQRLQQCSPGQTTVS